MSQIPLKKILLSILSGILLTAPFPPGRIDCAAWVALVPLLKGIEKESWPNTFKLGLISGLAHYLTLIYWIINVLNTYGGLNIIVSTAILLLFCLYLSIYIGLFSLFVHYITANLPFRSFIIAFSWVSMEYLRAKLFTGFPWCQIGYSQFRHLNLIQVVDITGVYGISFLIVLMNSLVYLFLFNKDSKPRLKIQVIELLIFIVLMGSVLSYGKSRLSDYDGKDGVSDPLRVAIIQANIDQSVKWNPDYQGKTLVKYLELTRSIYWYDPHLIVWPETALPFFFQDHTGLTEMVDSIGRESGAYMIFGSPAYARIDDKVLYYNRAYNLSPMGQVVDYYDKAHLVPFGEYVPLKRFLPFVHRLVPAAGDFAPGKDISPLKIPNSPAGVLICYEAIFPEISRIHIQKGAKIIINLTNDAWFGMTSAPYQHLMMSVFRAVESRRVFIRAANTGISAFIDPKGNVVKKGELFNEEILLSKIPTDDHPISIYYRYGDIFVYIALVICLIIFLRGLCYDRLEVGGKRSVF